MRDQKEDLQPTIVSLDNTFGEVKYEMMMIMVARFAIQWSQINQHKSVMSVGQHHKN
jgi:hypothetical protein